MLIVLMLGSGCKTGMVFITCPSENAQVVIDSAVIATAYEICGRPFPVPVGKRKIELRPDGAPPYIATVDVRQDKPVEINSGNNASLNPNPNPNP